MKAKEKVVYVMSRKQRAFLMFLDFAGLLFLIAAFYSACYEKNMLHLVINYAAYLFLSSYVSHRKYLCMEIRKA